MTLPTQTWRVSAKYNISTGSPTAAATSEVIAGLKAMFDAEDALGANYWSYSECVTGSTNNHILLKRKGSPTGTLATYRGIVYGVNSGTVNAANLLQATPSAVNYLYVGSSEDCNQNTVTNSVSAGALLSGKYVAGSTVGACNVGYSQGLKCFIVESDACCYIVITTTAGVNFGSILGIGELIEKFDGSSVWSNITTRGFTTGTEDLFTNADTAASLIIGALSGAAGSNPSGGYYNGGSRALGRCFGTYTTTQNGALQDLTCTYACVHPILIIERYAVTIPPSMLGVLRQVRITNAICGQQGVRNTAGSLIGYNINIGYNAYGHGLFFDQSP